MTILFIVAQFPPLNIAGAYRPARFVKELARQGHTPIVITLPPDQASQWFDTSLNADRFSNLANEVSVIQVPVDRPGQNKMHRWKHFFAAVDPLGEQWKANLAQALPPLIEEYQPDYILTSLPPFSVGRVVADIAKGFNIPFILDLRDAWSQWCIAPYRTFWHYQQTLNEEAYCLQAAELVLTTTNETADALAEVHGNKAKNKILVLPNGYDIPIAWKASIRVNPEKQRHFTIGYVGSFYYSPAARDNVLLPWYRKPLYKVLQYVPVKEDWLYRSPYFFFKAVRYLLDRRPELGNRLRIDFVGQQPSWLVDMMNEFALEPYITHHGFVSNERALALQQQFDAFLATSAKVEGRRDYSMGSKNYEYIRFQKPIIGFTPPGALQIFLQQSGLGVVADPDDPRAAAAKLESLLTFQSDWSPNRDYLKQFYLPNLVGELLDHLNDAQKRRQLSISLTQHASKI